MMECIKDRRNCQNICPYVPIDKIMRMVYRAMKKNPKIRIGVLRQKRLAWR